MAKNMPENAAFSSLTNTTASNNEDTAAQKANKAMANRSTNFSSIEDLFAIKAYLKASEDPISSAKQKGLVFKTKIEAAYNLLKQKQEDLELADSQKQPHLRMLLTDGRPPSVYPPRSGNSIHLQFKNTISPAIMKFISVVKANEIKSGEDPVVYKMRLLQLYKDRFGSNFKFYQCYEFAKETPKFATMFASDAGTTKKVHDVHEEQANKRAGSGNSSNRPMGTKKAKKSRKKMRWWTGWQRSLD